ncbi:unnamed protein product, partial [Hapterophycus canaliculatus]
GTISLLDTPGFENSEHNSLEQFCVNYVDEKLQQLFTEDVFKKLQAEHQDEGISRLRVDFKDNATLVNMLENPEPATHQRGLMCILAAQSRLPRGIDKTFMENAVGVRLLLFCGNKEH